MRQKRAPQPICGAEAGSHDYVLASGDRRLDRKIPERVHTLGQVSNQLGYLELRIGKCLDRLSHRYCGCALLLDFRWLNGRFRPAKRILLV